jgi:hypothetical protein
VARCGRCGLWSAYPEEHREQVYKGVCLWYQLRLREDGVFDRRDCPDFFESIPGMTPLEQFDYKIKRENIGDAYTQAKRAQRLAYTGILLSVLALVAGVVDMYLGGW